MIRAVPSEPRNDAGALGAMAQQLAQALRVSRLTVVVGEPGAGKTTLLAGVLPLLQRRAVDVSRAAAATPGVVVPFPDRRRRGLDGMQREWIHTVDRWDDASLQSLQLALEDDGHGRGRRPIADAMAPARLAAHIERHGGARLLFVFDHFEQLLEGARRRIGQQRFIEAWAAAVRSPQVQANFLVAVDERLWPWLRALCAGLPDADWGALRLQAQFGQRVLEPMIRPPHGAQPAVRTPLAAAASSRNRATDADFIDSVNDAVLRAARSARDLRSRGGDFDTSLPRYLEALGARLAGESGRTPLIARAEAQRRRAAAQRIAQARAEADATAQRERQQRAEAEARQRAAEAQAQAQAEAQAEAERRRATEETEAARQRAERAETPPEAHSEAHDDRPIEAPTVPMADLPIAALPVLRRQPQPVWRAMAVLVIGVGIAAWWWRSTTEPSPPTTPPPAVATVPQATPPQAATTPAPASPAPGPQAAPAAVPAAAPAATAVYDVLAVTAGGEHARLAREFVGALPSGVTPSRVEALARDVDPVAWLQQAPGRLGIARFDALRAAPQGARMVPLQVLTPLFAEPVLFVVSADSPLRTIRQLQGKRISVGPANSDASHTVRELYRRLFGAPLTHAATLAPDQAMAELVAFKSIDAIALVDAQPMAWWSALDPAVARRLRVLTLDPRHPQDNRLLQSLGTAPMRIAAPDGKGAAATTPAVMSYLVASGGDAAGADRLAAMAQALCRELPRLQKQGHPAWRDVRPTAQLDTGWPVVHAFRSTVSRCVRRQ